MSVAENWKFLLKLRGSSVIKYKNSSHQSPASTSRAKCHYLPSKFDASYLFLFHRAPRMAILSWVLSMHDRWRTGAHGILGPSSGSSGPSKVRMTKIHSCSLEGKLGGSSYVTKPNHKVDVLVYTMRNIRFFRSRNLEQTSMNLNFLT